MPMTPATLKARLDVRIKPYVEAATGHPMRTEAEAVWGAVSKAIAEAVIEEIVTLAVVTSTVTVASVSAVTPGVGASGPGVGTAVGMVA